MGSLSVNTPVFAIVMLLEEVVIEIPEPDRRFQIVLVIPARVEVVKDDEAPHDVEVTNPVAVVFRHEALFTPVMIKSVTIVVVGAPKDGDDKKL